MLPSVAHVALNRKAVVVLERQRPNVRACDWVERENWERTVLEQIHRIKPESGSKTCDMSLGPTLVKGLVAEAAEDVPIGDPDLPLPPLGLPFFSAGWPWLWLGVPAAKAEEPDIAEEGEAASEGRVELVRLRFLWELFERVLPSASCSESPASADVGGRTGTRCGAATAGAAAGGSSDDVGFDPEGGTIVESCSPRRMEAISVSEGTTAGRKEPAEGAGSGGGKKAAAAAVESCFAGDGAGVEAGAVTDGGGGAGKEEACVGAEGRAASISAGGGDCCCLGGVGGTGKA